MTPPCTNESNTVDWPALSVKSPVTASRRRNAVTAGPLEPIFIVCALGTPCQPPWATSSRYCAMAASVIATVCGERIGVVVRTSTAAVESYFCSHSAWLPKLPPVGAASARAPPMAHKVVEASNARAKPRRESE